MGNTTSFNWKQAIVLIGLMVPLILLWPTWIVWPLKILVVFFHELSHGLAAIATGGSIDHIEVAKEQGGLCVTRGGNHFVILMAGYLGSLIFGGLVLLLASRTRRDRLIVTVAGVIIVAATLAWVRPVLSFGFGFHLLAGLVLILLGRKLPEAVSDIFLKIFGLASCLYVIPDIWSDTIARSHLRSDARALAEMTSLPTELWGGLWIALALLLSAFFLIKSCRRQPGPNSQH